MSARITAPAADNKDIALSHAIDAANVATVGASFISDHIRPVVAAIVQLSTFDCMDVSALRGRIQLVSELAKTCLYLADDAAACMEGEKDEMNSKLAHLQGGAK